MNIDRVTYKKLTNEVEKLVKQGFDRQVVEEGLFDFVSNMGTGVAQAAKGELAQFALKQLGIIDPESFLGLAITNFFANVELKDYGKLTDCEFVTEQLAKSLIESFFDEFRKEKGLDSFIYTAIKDSIVETAASSNLYKTLAKKLTTFVCPLVSQIADKFDFSDFN